MNLVPLLLSIPQTLLNTAALKRGGECDQRPPAKGSHSKGRRWQAVRVAFLARRRRRAAAARKIQAAVRARQARLLEAFIESLVFFPELGDITFYNW